MKNRILQSLFILTCVVFGFLLWKNEIIIGENVSFSEKETHSELQTNALNFVESIGFPAFISIPSIELKAPIERVNIAADGSMDVPKNHLNTGWYELGPRPGEIGSAVIAGHLDWKNNTPAVFKDLHKLKIGDKISVEDEKGASVSFVVREIRKYDAGSDASDVFISNDGKAHLNIITCDGSWDKKANQYSKRLIIFADKELEQGSDLFK